MPPKANKLLEKMRQTKTNWKSTDIISLYEGFGFSIIHGAKHDLVRHPDYLELKQTIPRHKKVKPYIVREAVKLIDKLLELQANESEKEDTDNEQ